MKKILVLLAIASTFSALAGNTSVKVIYGDDNRVDVINSTNPMYVELSKSTAGMIPKSSISTQSNGDVTIASRTLQSSMRVCSDERFSQQPTAAYCSGFLIGEDLLVTAGHCIKSKYDCGKYNWVFDYKIDYEGQAQIKSEKKNIYSCKKIISRSLDNATKDDYALIQLDRKVTDRRILDYRRSGKISVGQKIVVIGHPSGLPTKIADGAKVRRLEGKYFVANLDTYGGNSGSAVFNADNGMIEGILVRGAQDYKRDWGKKCMVSNTLGDDAGRGEDVTFIGNIPQL